MIEESESMNLQREREKKSFRERSRMRESKISYYVPLVRAWEFSPNQPI